MKLTGARILMECLREQKVDTIFGYPGGTILNVYDALYDYKEITHILTSHEQGAAHAADGYARSTGKVGVCFATSGPGATNLTTGIATAYMDSSSVVFISCNVPQNLIGRDAFQEVDITGITMPITKSTYLVRDVTKLADTVREAFALARSGRPGPVVIDITRDVTSAECDYEPLPLEQHAASGHLASLIRRAYTSSLKMPEADLDDVEKLVEMIAESKKPMLICGGGVVRSRAHEEFRQFVRRIDAPVAITVMGGGGVSGRDVMTTGMIGMHGSVASNMACDNCDLLIAVGCRFSDRVALKPETFAHQAKIVHIDIDRAEINKNVQTDHHIIGDAKQESIDMILRAAAAKQTGKIERLFVVGCLSERYAEELRAELPEVDEFFGVKDWDDIVRALEATPRPALATERRLTTPKHYAYLKISEGCNWKCGYCAIPLIRGPHASVPMETLLEEARKLAAGGVRELIVIAQDTTYYGLDLYGKRRLAELLEALCRIDGIRWIRLHYAYPTAFPDEVIEVMAREPKICKYLDIPFQHISDDQLAAMHRRHTKAQAYELIDKLRQAIPDLALRTTLLVGYPGETEADFEELLEFVRTVRFERLGVFPYSEEEGTYSARNLPDDVPEEVKQSRVERVMALQNEISLENNRARIGQLERVIIDSRQGDFYVGRSQYDSPEVDQEILIPAAGRRLIRGCFYQVRITAAEDYDLYGELETK